MTEMQRHEDLQSEVRGTQHLLIALLQERLETEQHLKASRAELEQVTRGIESARSEQTRQAVEFDLVVQRARAEGRTLAAEIEELVRQRDAVLEHTLCAPDVVEATVPVPAAPEPVTLNAPAGVEPTVPVPAARVELPAAPEPVTPTCHAPQADKPAALSTVPEPAPSVLSAVPRSAPQAATPAVEPADPQTAPRLVTPALVWSAPKRAAPLATPSVPQRAPQLSLAAVSAAVPVRLAGTLPSVRAQLTPHRYTAVLAHVHRPSLRQLANLVIGCVLACLAILLTPVSQVAGGLQLLAVMSGSMEPTIQVGGIVGVRPVAATDLQVGNVITFATQANPDVLVTHRIVSLETRDGQTMVTTKGDANDSVDAMAAPADHAVGRVDFSLPWLGYLMVWLASPVAKILILVLTVISFAWPSVKRATPAAAGPAGGGNTAPATSYTALEDEIQALLTPAPPVAS